MKKELTPKRIVEELDKYIIGQSDAKRAVAIAFRNRWRRQQVKGELYDEIIPNNIILIGPTGVGKTEIARRISKLTNAPFIKVEASKFTEVGYVGRDVESMVRELLSIAINAVRNELSNQVAQQAYLNARELVLDLLLPKPPAPSEETPEEKEVRNKRYSKQREKLMTMLDQKKLDEREVEITHNNSPFKQLENISGSGFSGTDFQFGDFIGGILPLKGEKKSEKVKIPAAIGYFFMQEKERMVNREEVIKIARERVQNDGIIFIDEIDKIAVSEKKGGVDVSRSGVQRDLLPIVEGSNVPTKHGIINTKHILFIAAGAFSQAKPSDLIPELQGRFPIREELNSLTKEDFINILTKPKTALTRQYAAMLSAEKVKIDFREDALELIADYTEQANEKMEDIGARRLHTIMNTLLEGFLFDIPDVSYEEIVIDRETVKEKLQDIISSEDLSNYIL